DRLTRLCRSVRPLHLNVRASMLEPAHIAGTGLRETCHRVEWLARAGSGQQLSAEGISKSLRQERLRMLAPGRDPAKLKRDPATGALPDRPQSHVVAAHAA